MKTSSLIMLFLGSVAVTCCSSCSALQKYATAENFGRAIIIVDEARRIAITPDK